MAYLSIIEFASNSKRLVMDEQCEFGIQSGLFRRICPPFFCLSSVFSAFRMRDSIISSYQNTLSLPRSDPRRLLCTQGLAFVRLESYYSSGDKDDLEQSILAFTEAVFLPRPWDTYPLNIVGIFSLIAIAISYRAEKSRQPGDVKSCIMYLRYLREQGGHSNSNRFPIPITAPLIRTLMVHIELGLGDVHQDIEEMAALLDELIKSDTSMLSLDSLIMNFAEAVYRDLVGQVEWRIPSDKVIECLRNARMRLPDLYQASLVLARSLQIRFLMAPSDEDYKEGMAILHNILTCCNAGGMPSPFRDIALRWAAIFETAQFYTHGKPEHLEQAIRYYRSWLDVALEDPDRPFITALVSRLQGQRFHDLGLSGLCTPSANLPSIKDMMATLAEFDPVKPISMAMVEGFFNGVNLTLLQDLTDIVDIERCIKFCEQSIASYPSSHSAPLARLSLGFLFGRAAEYTGEIKYLNQAISITRENINLAYVRPLRDDPVVSVIQLLQLRLENFRNREDLDELMELYPMVSTHQHVTSAMDCSIPCVWAMTAHSFEHPSASTAYDRAMSSIQVSIIFSPTIDVQHSRLSAMSEKVKTLPLDYTSYQIHTGRLKQAIETLEQGRTLLWSEMRGLRTSTDKLRSADIGETPLC